MAVLNALNVRAAVNANADQGVAISEGAEYNDAIARLAAVCRS